MASRPSRPAVLMASAAAALTPVLVPGTSVAARKNALGAPYASCWYPDSRRVLGATCRRAFWAAGLAPEQGEPSARLEVRAVGELYTASTAATAVHP
ncbi:hypothetical protein ABZ070_04620 [Streptomyces sp. NPDC006283]|uniref:hypothetical protein n=1 Tax=Streptomyces sp. NPDC006283 TaxID=3156741 RepID=UPI0033B7A93B